MKHYETLDYSDWEEYRKGDYDAVMDRIREYVKNRYPNAIEFSFRHRHDDECVEIIVYEDD